MRFKPAPPERMEPQSRPPEAPQVPAMAEAASVLCGRIDACLSSPHSQTSVVPMSDSMFRHLFSCTTPVSQTTCSVHDCSTAASEHCPADKLHVRTLKEQCEPALCPAHYQQCVGHATSAWCKSRLTPHHRWKAPNFQLAEHVLRSTHNITILEKSRFCRCCYQKQIDMLPDNRCTKNRPQATACHL